MLKEISPFDTSQTYNKITSKLKAPYKTLCFDDLVQKVYFTAIIIEVNIMKPAPGKSHSVVQKKKKKTFACMLPGYSVFITVPNVLLIYVCF